MRIETLGLQIDLCNYAKKTARGSGAGAQSRLASLKIYHSKSNFQSAIRNPQSLRLANQR